MASGEMLRTDTRKLLPWRWAESMQSCSLFWIPARLGSIPRGQREWLLEFLIRLTAHLLETNELQPTHFMQMQVIDEDEQLRKSFTNALLKESPLLGRCWLPRGKQPTPASDEEVELLANKKKKFQPYDYASPQAWWFLSQDDRQLCEHYLGYGGLTILFMKPAPEILPIPSPAFTMPVGIPKFLRNDPGLKVLLEDFNPQKPHQIPGFLRNHPAMRQVFSLFDVDKVHEKNKVLAAPFREQSKEIFGADISRGLEYEGIPFVLPKLASQDFFSHKDQQIRRWFEIFDVYINESPEDEGIVMACKDNLTSTIESIVSGMRTEGYRYWEG